MSACFLTRKNVWCGSAAGGCTGLFSCGMFLVNRSIDRPKTRIFLNQTCPKYVPICVQHTPGRNPDAFQADTCGANRPEWKKSKNTLWFLVLNEKWSISSSYHGGSCNKLFFSFTFPPQLITACLDLIITILIITTVLIITTMTSSRLVPSPLHLVALPYDNHLWNIHVSRFHVLSPTCTLHQHFTSCQILTY